jgi:putative colanic acid biosynthesis acetyltransferase WcaB
MSFFRYLFQDWEYNAGNTKGRLVAFFFRLSNYYSKSIISKIILFPYLIFYKVVFEYFIGIELPHSLKIKKGLRIYHLQAIVINKDTVIGENFTIRHSLTIGNRGDNNTKCPVIGNNVNVGANVCIIGDIDIGDSVNIGAGSIVVKDIPAYSTVVGNPARIIKGP